MMSGARLPERNAGTAEMARPPTLLDDLLNSVLPRRGGDLSESNLADVYESGIDGSAAGLRRPNRHWCLMPDK
jgi:hypothetical protein